MGVGTLVAIEENSGRRNWSRCKEYTDVLNSNTLLFQDNCVTQAALSELSRQDQQAIHPAVASCIDSLLSQKKHGNNVQVQLDTHLLVSLLPLSLQSFFLDKIDLLSPHLLHPDHVDDIGYIVRNVLMHKTRICILSKIYHFTMPFIKHNRLNFPPMRFVSKSHLMHMLQIISLTCLGLQTSSTKQPTWTIRRQLFVFFFNLSTRGSLRDIYLFIQHHTYLLRLALMEHFINFVKKHMVQELKVMQSCNVFRYDFVRIHRLVQYITDTFRMTSMQGENLDWDTIEGKAQVSVERCNRSCKTNTPIPFSPRVNLSQSINAKTFRKILEMPALNATTLMQSCQDHDLFFTAARWTVSKTICKFPLPFFLQYRQFAQVQSKSFEPFNKTLISRSLLYVCLRCNQRHSEARTDMRLCCPHLPICINCNSSDYVCVADTVGHLVRVYGNYYYFCDLCHKVHIWQGFGSELSTCLLTRAQKVAAPRRQCAVCVRSMFLTPMSVFDKKLGVMQTVFLCSKHCPPVPQRRFVYDIASLRRLILHLS